MGSDPVIIPHDSVYSKMERAKRFARNLRLASVPHTQHEITQMQEQLKYLQLFRGGFPICPHTVAKKLNIDNYGTIEGATEFEKWKNWEKLKLELTAQGAQLAGSLGLGGGQDQGTGPKGGQKGSGGRPPSGKKPPAIKQKGASSGNPRTTVTES